MTAGGDPHGAVLAVCGLASEARIAAGRGVRTLAGGGDAGGLARAIEAEIGRGGVRGVISFGIAGALAPGWRPGRLLVADAVLGADGERHATDAAWAGALRRRLLAPTPYPLAPRAGHAQAPCETRPAPRRGELTDSLSGVIFSGEAIVATTADKAALHAATGAAAVDMESLQAARLAARHGLRLAILRAIADPAERSLPPAALVAMRPGGGIALAAVIDSLLRSPAQLAGLLALARDARAALRALGDGRRRLGDGLGDLDLDELSLHVV